MIAHVAEAAENSGRVILQLTSNGPPSPVALAAALHVAKSFNAGIESLFVEDPQLFDFAQFGFAREVPSGGGPARELTVASLEAEFERRAANRHGEVAAAVAGTGVPLHCRTWRDHPAEALSAACSENGPWNVAVLAEAVSATNEAYVCELTAYVQDVTGFVVAGPSASRTRGPVIAIVEQLAHVQPVLRAAERLAEGAREDVHLILFGGNADELAWTEGQVRLMLGGDVPPDLILAPDLGASAEALASVLQDLGAGFVIAPLGGTLLPLEGGLADFAASHHGPLFLIR